MKLATYRWLARQLFNTLSFGTYDSQSAWIEKARKVAVAPRTVEGMNAALVNFAWMAKLPISHADRSRYEKILSILDGREFIENLPEAVKA